MEVWAFLPRNQLHISFMTVWQYWVGMSKTKTVFRPSNKFLRIAEFLLTDPAEYNVTMGKATGLISLLFSVAHAFSPTVVHTMHASWIPLCPPLCPSSFR